MLSLASSFPGAVGVCEKLFDANEEMKNQVKSCASLKGLQSQGNFVMEPLPSLVAPSEQHVELQ